MRGAAGGISNSCNNGWKKRQFAQHVLRLFRYYPSSGYELANKRKIGLAAIVAVRERPDRQAFLTRHAEIADALAGCLDGLDFIYAVGPQLNEAPSTEAAAPSPLGDFRILREVGRGGMGIVDEAEQMSLSRRVALKVLPFAATLDPKQLQRLQNEARAAARLHHTNIVPVYYAGCDRGVHFYAMQFIDGQSVAEIIADRGVSPPAGVAAAWRKAKKNFAFRAVD
jgi:hypothetical protein